MSESLGEGTRTTRFPYCVYRWFFDTKEAFKLFKKFQRLTVVSQGRHPTQVLQSYIINYVITYRVEFTVVTFDELVERLHPLNMYVTKNTMIKYRKAGLLVDEKGRPAWFTDGVNTYYNFEAVRDFINKRHLNCYSKRLSEEKDEQRRQLSA